LFSGFDQFVRFFGGFFTSAPSMSAVFLFKPTAALGGALALVALLSFLEGGRPRLFPSSWAFLSLDSS
jgi:hypothetical protein